MEEYYAKIGKLGIDHKMTTDEALAYILYVEEGLRGNELSNEMSKILGKDILPQNANTYKQRAIIKFEKNKPEIGIDEEGREVRWIVDTFNGRAGGTEICLNEEDAVRKARQFYNHLTTHEKKNMEICVGTVSIGADGEPDVANFHSAVEWQETAENGDE